MTNDRTLNSAREAVRAGCGYLAGAQAPSGYFPGKSSTVQHDFGGAVATRTTFNTSMVATILGGMKSSDERLRKMCGAASRFLLSQKNSGGSWSYWAKGFARSALPDDLDDTFCALAAVQLANPSEVTPDILNEAVSLLVAAEEHPGGLYRTWVVDSGAGVQWRDIDLSVNCNVAYFLQLQGIRVHILEAYIQGRATAGNFSSAYYPDTLAVKYFLSRLNFVGKSLLGIDEVQDVGSAAMALSIAPNSERAHVWVEKILGGACANGSWPAFGFCLDPVVEGERYYAGSASLTTALCVSALEAWLTTQEPVQVQPENIHAAYAVKKCTDELRQFSSSWRDLGIRYLKKLEPLLVEITSIHVGFARACGLLETSPALEENSSFMLHVAYASLCGWIAFTIYDDVVDGDADPSVVVLANHFFSVFQDLYSVEFSNETSFKRVMFCTVRRVTQGSMHEVNNCRIGGDLNPSNINSLRIANRSMGHSLSCTAVLFKSAESGRPKALSPLGSTTEFFKFYLAARQLLDDGHDWKQDYEAGILNSVAADLLNVYALLQLPEPMGLQWMEKEFAERGLQRLCGKVCERVAQARAVVDAEPCFKDKSFFYELLEPLRMSAEAALHGAAQGKAFVLAYSKNV